MVTIEKCPVCERETFHDRKSFLMEAECLECKWKNEYICDPDIQAKSEVHGENTWKGY